MEEQVFQQRKNDLEGKIVSKDREIAKLREEYEKKLEELGSKMNCEVEMSKNNEM